MANPTCAPFTDEPLFVTNVPDEELLESTQAAFANDVRTQGKGKGFDNTDAANAARMGRHFLQMTGMTPDEMLKYVNKQLDKFGKNRKDNPYYNSLVSNMLAATDIHWQRRAAGVQNMARSYIAQRAEGQEPIAQAAEFLRQLKAFNDLGRKIAGDNLSAGSALRQKRIAKQQNFSEDMFQGAQRELNFSDDYIKGVEENLSYYERIQQLINQNNWKEALEEMDKLSKQIDMYDNPIDMAGVISRWHGTWKTWDEVWINGLLSSTSTFAVNATGAAWVLMRPLLQGGFAKALQVSGLGGEAVQAGATQAAAEASAQLGAMYASFGDALALGWRAAKTEKSILMTTNQNITAANIRSGGFGEKIPASEELDRAIDLVGQIVRLPSRGMLGMDEFAKILALRGEVAANGVKRAVQKGVNPLDKEALAEFVSKEARLAFDVDAGSLEARYAFNPGDGLADTTGRAQLYMDNTAASGLANVQSRAREAVFQEQNRLAQQVGKVARLGQETLGFAPLKPFVPFVTTPTNILKQGIGDSLGINAGLKAAGITRKTIAAEGMDPKAVYNALMKELLNDPAESARIGGQVAFMTIAAGAIYGMAMDGRLTGGGPEQWARGREAFNQQQSWLKQNNVPYSFEVAPGVRIPIGRLGEPFATPLRMIADLGYYSGYMDRTGQDTAIAQIVGIMSAGFFEASFLTGFDDFMRIVTAGKDWDYEMGRGVQNYVATQMPFGSLLAQIDRTTSPYKRAYEGATFTEFFKYWELEMGEGVFGKLLNRMPGFENQPPLTDQLTGEYVPVTPGVGPNGLNALQQAVPFYPRNTSADPVWDAVMDIRGTYQEKSFAPELKGSRTEQQAFNKVMSQIKINGRTVSQAILAYRARPEVEEFVRKKGVVLRGADIQDDLDKIIRKYHERAKREFIRSNPNLIERLQVAEALDYANNRGDVDTVKELESQLDELVLRAKKGY